MNNGDVILSPVSVYDLREFVAPGETRLGVFCRHQNLNKWAKYKPVSSQILSPLSSFDVNTGEWSKENERWGKPWYYGESGVYEIKEYGTVQDIKADAGWSYVKPHGGSLSPFRLGDFRGYYSGASCPWSVGLPVSFQNGGSFTFALNCEDIDYSFSGQWQHDELLTLLASDEEEWHIGCLLYNESKGNAVCYANRLPWHPLTEDSWYLRGSMRNGWLYIDDFALLSANTGDTIFCSVFMTTEWGGHSFIEGTKKSLKFNDDTEVFKALKVTQSGQPVKPLRQQPFTFPTTPAYSVHNLPSPVFYEKDGSYYKASRTLVGISGSISMGSVSLSNNPNLNVAILFYTRSGEINSYQSAVCYLSANGGSQSFAMNTEMARFTAYGTLQALESGSGGTSVTGVPLPDECLYSPDSADYEGAVSVSEASFAITNAETASYTYYFYCPDNSNKINL